MSEQAISRVLFSRPVARAGTMTIHLVSTLPSRSSDLPGNSGGPPSNVPLFGLAPGGVCLAPVVTDKTGELLPHPFTLTPARIFWMPSAFLIGSSDPKLSAGAVSFLWHFPARRRDWVLPSTLSCGARTFLPPALSLWNPYQGFLLSISAHKLSAGQRPFVLL